MYVASAAGEFTLDSRSGRPIINYYLPLPQGLERSPRIWYEWKARLEVALTTKQEHGVPPIKLEPYGLGFTPLKRSGR